MDDCPAWKPRDRRKPCGHCGARHEKEVFRCRQRKGPPPPAVRWSLLLR